MKRALYIVAALCSWTTACARLPTWDGGDAGVEGEQPDAGSAGPVLDDAGTAMTDAGGGGSGMLQDAGGGSPGSDGSVFPFPFPDAAPGTPDAGPPRMCTTPVTYGDVGEMGGPAFWSGEPSPNITVRHSPDVQSRLALFMNAGKGVFANGFQTGAFELDQGINNCGACMYLTVYSPPPNGTFVAQYEAVTGSISISQMPQGPNQPLTFVAAGVTFVETIGTDVGCTTSIDRVSFSGIAAAP